MSRRSCSCLWPDVFSFRWWRMMCVAWRVMSDSLMSMTLW